MAKPIYFAHRFGKTWNSLSEAQRQRVIDIILALPDLLKNPYQHSGYGFRKLRGRNFYEARVDLR